MSRTSHPSAGFGLIELMIAMTLGLLVLGAAFAVFQSNLRTFNANDGQNRIQENARVAYAMLANDVRGVSSSACSAESSVRGSDSSSDAFRNALSVASGKITTVSAEDMSYRIASGATASAITLVETTPAAKDVFKANDIVMVCNGSMTGFAKVGSVSGQTITFSAALPFNPGDTLGASPASVSIASLRNHTWSVAANGGTTANSMYVNRNDGSGDQEVANGVQSLTATYHVTGRTDYVASGSANFVPQSVDAVRVSMPIRSVMPGKSGGESQTINRNVAATVAIRNRGL